MLRFATVILAFAAFMIVDAADARGAAVSGNILDDGVTGDGGVWTTSTPVAGVPGANQYSQPGGGNLVNGPHGAQFAANIINLSVSITQLFVPAEIQFTTIHGLSGTPRFYRVNVSLTNNVGPQQHPISPVLFQLTGLGGGPRPSGVAFSPRDRFVPTSTYNGQYVPITASSMLFGGQSGGGGELYPGQTAVFSFGLQMDDSINSNPFALRVTANPEPASLALGSLALGSVVAYRRRRRKQGSQGSEGDAEPTVSIA